MGTKDFWNPQRVEDRAKSMRAEADADKRIADMRIMNAVRLEDIALAWEASLQEHEPETAEWLLWGDKVKCSNCGSVEQRKRNFCAECGRKMG